MSSLLFILQPDMDSRTLACFLRSFHMHRQIIVPDNLFTDIKKQQTRCEIGKWIAFHRDITSKVAIWFAIALATQQPSPLLLLNLTSIWWVVWEALCGGQSIRVQQGSMCEQVMNWALRRAGDILCPCATVESQNLASSDYFLVEMSLPAFVIFWGWYQHTP